MEAEHFDMQTTSYKCHTSVWLSFVSFKVCLPFFIMLKGAKVDLHITIIATLYLLNLSIPIYNSIPSLSDHNLKCSRIRLTEQERRAPQRNQSTLSYNFDLILFDFHTIQAFLLTMTY